MDTLWVTNAPDQYDGFGTTTVALGEDDYRLVSIVDQHSEWQVNRYASGLYGICLADVFTERTGRPVPATPLMCGAHMAPWPCPDHEWSDDCAPVPSTLEA